jgi:hypothetical protein
VAAAFAVITLGSLFVYSALKGIGITDIFAGSTGKKLDPAGGVVTEGADSPPRISDAFPGTGGTDPKGQFKGPHAGLLRQLADDATGRFHLRITQICRPKSATYGSATSLHKECRAFDASGKPADMLAYARYAVTVSGVDEVFYDPAGLSAPGFAHTDHVHTGA